jgi:ParB family chromosome partitioning protein
LLIQNLKISEVYPNPEQPRKTFKDSSLEELANSIKENGLIQPIIVVKRSGYMIVSGERRFRACKLLNMEEIKAIVIDATDKKVQELALIENIQREDMNAVETALAYQDLINSGLTVEEISQKIGKKTQQIKFYLQLVKLNPIIQEAVRKEIINIHTAWELARLEDQEDQVFIFRKIINSQLKAAEAGSFITAYINSKNQITIPVEITENEKDNREFKNNLEAALENSAKIVDKIYYKLEKNQNLTADEVLIKKLALLGKAINKVQNMLETNRRNAELLSSLKAVS